MALRPVTDIYTDALRLACRPYVVVGVVQRQWKGETRMVAIPFAVPPHVHPLVASIWAVVKASRLDLEKL